MKNDVGKVMTLGQRLATFLAMGLGLGYLPKAPGTFGTLLALPLGWLLGSISLGPALIIFAVVTAVFLTAIAVTEKALGIHDDPRIVGDEVVGMAAAFLFFPPSVLSSIVAFAVFRTLDIWKPGPIGWCDEHLPGTWGTTLDDLLAGIATGVVLYCLRMFWPI
jgi:phosphatidylglycerophosphatase A